MPRIYLKTFGCKVNFSDSQALAAELARAGYPATELTPEALADPPPASEDPAPADSIVIVNSCCVTAEAERKARQFVRKMRRHWPAGAVLFSGCAARHPRLRGQFAAAGAIVLPEAADVVAWLGAHAAPPRDVAAPVAAEPATGRTRAFIKVQDGCANRCSYCIVPDVRPFASRPLSEVLAEVRQRVAEGHRELVLTGINIGHYGLAPVASLRRPDGASRYEPIPGHPTFGDLVECVARALPDGFRLRLSSVEPEHFAERLFDLLAAGRLCPHLHLPLQSGSDAVLAAMHRRYRTADYRALAERFRAVCPQGALTTDILVGYPTETEADFQETLAFASALGFERIHGFPFSPRPGTPAAELTPLPVPIVTERNRRLIAHGRAIADARWSRMLGTVAQVLVEERRDNAWLGHGEAYQIVRLPVAADCTARQIELRGLIVPARLSTYAAGEFTGAWLS